MGKKTVRMSGAQMREIVHQHLVDNCDNVTEKSVISIRRDGQYGWNFSIAS